MPLRQMWNYPDLRRRMRATAFVLLAHTMIVFSAASAMTQGYAAGIVTLLTMFLSLLVARRAPDAVSWDGWLRAEGGFLTGVVLCMALARTG